jgi:hypothetical protein
MATRKYGDKQVGRRLLGTCAVAALVLSGCTLRIEDRRDRGAQLQQIEQRLSRMEVQENVIVTILNQRLLVKAKP